MISLAQLYHHIAPRIEGYFTGETPIRLLHNCQEVQSVVLTLIALTFTKQKSDTFKTTEAGNTREFSNEVEHFNDPIGDSKPFVRDVL